MKKGPHNKQHEETLSPLFLSLLISSFLTSIDKTNPITMSEDLQCKTARVCVWMCVDVWMWMCVCVCVCVCVDVCVHKPTR